MLQSVTLDPVMSSFVKTAKSSIEEECASLESLLQTERKSRVANSETNAEFFCSQSVATVLKAMGVLPSSIPTTEYLPCSFSSYIGLPLLKGASFSKEVYIRGSGETMSVLTVPKVSEEGEKMEGSDVSVEGKEKMEGSDVSVEGSEKMEGKEKMEGDVKKMEGDVKKMEGNEKMEGKAFSYTIKDVLTPDQFQYLQTQLRLSRSFGRCSDDTLHALLQSTPVYPTPPLAHL